MIGVSCREHVSEPQLPAKAGNPLLRAVTFHSGYLRVDARQIAESARWIRAHVGQHRRHRSSTIGRWWRAIDVAAVQSDLDSLGKAPS